MSTDEETNGPLANSRSRSFCTRFGDLIFGLTIAPPDVRNKKNLKDLVRIEPPSEFMEEVMPPGTAGAKHVAEAGRYHLFVSGVCPWASSCRSARHLLGLEDVVSMDVADGQSGAGWVLLNGTACSPWAETAASGTPFYLHEVYRTSDPLCTTRITMPVLWDKHLNIIVSNDSGAIVKVRRLAWHAE